MNLADLKMRIQAYEKTGDKQLEREIHVFSKILEEDVEDEWKKIDPYRVELRRRLMKELGLRVLPERFHDGWALANDSDPCFIDNTGKRLSVETVWGTHLPETGFKDGLAVGYSVERGKYNKAFIKSNGEVVVAIKDPLDRHPPQGNVLMEELHLAQDGFAHAMVNRLHFFVDINTFERLNSPVDTREGGFYRDARDFHEGLAAVQTRTGKWTYINKAGARVNPVEFDVGAGDFQEGRAWVQLQPNNKGNSFWLIDKNLMAVNNNAYRNVTRISEGLVGAESSEGVWQFIDLNGKFAIDDLYEDVHYQGFQEGKCAVKKDGNWVFIGRKGNELFGGERFDHVISGFENGRSAVRQGFDYYFIDENGRKVLGPYNAIHQSFIDGIAQVATDEGGSCIDWYGRDVYRED